MDKKIRLVAGLAAVFAMGSVHAQAQCLISLPSPVTAVNAETGHTYELYNVPDINWATADACAKTLTEGEGAQAVTGHLATITSSRENTWIVETLVKAIAPGNPTISRQVWVGGFQTPLPSPAVTGPGDGWSWVNNEGPFGGVNGVGVYTNWSVDDPTTGTTEEPIIETEPNDAPTAGENNQENHLTLGRFSKNLGAWNDEGSNLPSIYGFIVEFDTVRLVSDCKLAGGCETVAGQRIQFPETAVGESFTFAAYEFLDPRWNPATGRCDRLGQPQELEVFAEDDFKVETSPGSGVFVSGAIKVPAILCGSPKFLIVRAEDNGGISVPSGVVETTNNTVNTDSNSTAAEILPGNLFDCKGPSPQQKDVGVWQDLDPAKMRESKSTYTGYFGSVAELTTSCGSTVLKTVKKSNFLVGLHYDFGVPFGSAAEYQAFLDLTKRKVSLTLESVNDAIVNKSFIKNPDGQAMQSQLTAVLAALNKNDLTNARKKTLDFLNKVKSSGYKSGTQAFNYNGDHLSRGENILFMLNNNLIPFKNSPVLP